MNTITLGQAKVGKIIGVAVPTAGAVETSMIAVDAIESTLIAAGEILTTHIKAGEIETTLIGAGEIKTTLILAGEIESTLIAAGEILTTHITAISAKPFRAGERGDRPVRAASVFLGAAAIAFLAVAGAVRPGPVREVHNAADRQGRPHVEGLRGERA